MSYNPNAHFFEWISQQELTDQDNTTYKNMYVSLGVHTKLDQANVKVPYSFILDQLKSLNDEDWDSKVRPDLLEIWNQLI